MREEEHIRLLFAIVVQSQQFQPDEQGIQWARPDEDVPAKVVQKARNGLETRAWGSESLPAADAPQNRHR